MSKNLSSFVCYPVNKNESFENVTDSSNFSSGLFIANTLEQLPADDQVVLKQLLNQLSVSDQNNLSVYLFLFPSERVNVLSHLSSEVSSLIVLPNFGRWQSIIDQTRPLGFPRD